MLEIKINLDKQAAVPLCKRCGKIYSEAFYLYQAVDRGQVLATALFEVHSQAVYALLYESVEPDDAFLLDGILRAGLNYAASQGIETGVLPEELRTQHGHLFSRLNYPAAMEFNIVNFFQKYKSCRPQ